MVEQNKRKWRTNEESLRVRYSINRKSSDTVWNISQPTASFKWLVNDQSFENDAYFLFIGNGGLRFLFQNYIFNNDIIIIETGAIVH